MCGGVIGDAVSVLVCFFYWEAESQLEPLDYFERLNPRSQPR